MISLQREGGLLVVGLFGEVTLADYRSFETELAEQMRQSGRVDLLVDLRAMLSSTLDVVWEDIKFSRTHSHDVRRIAMLSDARWAPWSAWLSQLFLDAQVRVFDDEALARGWLDGAET